MNKKYSDVNRCRIIVLEKQVEILTNIVMGLVMEDEFTITQKDLERLQILPVGLVKLREQEEKDNWGKEIFEEDDAV